ncbi:MAG: hypothetical protein ACOC0G_02030 [Thermodesulfobacteriota bacterium]
MFFIPLSQLESVGLVVHALRAAAGEADCSQCPVRKVCMQQCLTIADSIESMIKSGTLPTLGEEETHPDAQEEAAAAEEKKDAEENQDRKGKGKKGHLEIIK